MVIPVVARVRRLVPQRLPPDAGRPPTTCAAAHAAALASRGSADAARRGRGRRRDRHVLPGLQGRHRHGVAGHARRATRSAVLLLTNFGERERLTVAGVPVGRLLPAGADAGPPRPAGSCIGVVVTDAPVDGAGCARLARRVGLGLARDRLGRPPRQRRDLPAASTTGLRPTATARPPAGPRVAGPRPRPAVRGGRRGHRGGGAELDAHRAHHRRPRRQHQRGARPRDRSARSWRRPAVTGTEQRRADHRWPTASSWPPRSTCPTRRRAAAVPARGAALPQGRPDLVVRRRATSGCATSSATPSAGVDLRGTGSSARRRHRRVPAGGAARPGRGDRLARRRRSGATARSACSARRTPASTRCRSRASGRPRSRRSARSTPPTTAGPTTCTGAAARCGWSTSSTTATT